jgi:hypothetical protein
MNNAYQKWLAGEGCCNAHNFINIEVPDCGREDVCDCENILEQISNLHTDDGILQEEIDYVSGVVDTISGGCDCDLSDYYTKEEVDALIPEVPSLSGYATEQWVLDKHYITGVDLSDYATHQWVENKNYLTEHQPLKTINGQVISGTGNIEITASGGTINVDYELDPTSTNPVVNSAITVAINAKLDASAYTPTEQVQSDWNVTDAASTAYIKNKPEIPSLSGYATEQWVLDKHYITGVDLSDYALKSEIPVVPTSNSAFTNDMHYITSGDSVFNNSYTTGDTYTKTEVNNIVSNKIWCGTQAQYDAIQDKQNDVLYLIHS